MKVTHATLLDCYSLLLLLTVTMTISESRFNEGILQEVNKRSDQTNSSSSPKHKLPNRVGSFFSSLATMKPFANRQGISSSDAKLTTVGCYLFSQRLYHIMSRPLQHNIGTRREPL